MRREAIVIDPKAEQKKFNWRKNLQAWKYIPPFFKMIWQSNPWLFVLNVLARLVKSLVPVAILWVGKLIIDEVIDLRSLEIAERDFQTLWYYVGIEIGLVIISDGLNRFVSLTDALLSDLFTNASSAKLIEKAGLLDLAQFEDPNIYDKLERARRQTTGRAILMTNVLAQLQDIITITSLIIGLIVLAPLLIILLFVGLIPNFFNEAYYSWRGYSLIRSWTPERRELDYIRYVGASDVTAKEMKLFGLSNYLKERYSTLADKYYQANRQLALKRSSTGFLLNLLNTAAYYGAYVLIIVRTIAGIFTIGELTFLSGSFSRLRNQFQSVLSRFNSITENALYLQDYFEFIELADAQTQENTEKLPFPPEIKVGFEFHNVSFQYVDSDQWALKNVSIKIPAAEKLALVGENGAGKTTLIKLITRLYKPTEGYITLDGIEIDKFDIQSYQKNIGVIFQDYVRYYFTARENIAVGDIVELENQPLIEEASAKSLANSVVDELALGYDQMLGKRFKQGQELSGGQWQKVALARAYMKEAQLVILDEPTSALDARAEYEVFQRFIGLTKSKTSIIISHRFSTVRMADKILVLKNGRVLEYGSHENLLLEDGLYAELFSLQAAGYQ